MEKGHSTVFHNAWGQKKKIFIEKTLFNRLEAKKTKTFIEKLIRVLKTL